MIHRQFYFIIGTVITKHNRVGKAVSRVFNYELYKIFYLIARLGGFWIFSLYILFVKLILRANISNLLYGDYIYAYQMTAQIWM